LSTEETERSQEETVMRKLRSRRGFTMVELMIVLLIVTILTAIGAPFYMRHIREGKKLEAYAVIDTAVAGARVHYMKHRTYEGADFGSWLAQDDVDNAVHFTFAVSGLTVTGFTIEATVLGTWGPVAGKVVWKQTGADAAMRDPGDGSYAEAGW